MRNNRILVLLLFVFPFYHSFSQIIDKVSVNGGVGRSNSSWVHRRTPARTGAKGAIFTNNIFLSTEKKVTKRLGVKLDIGLDQTGYKEYLYDIMHFGFDNEKSIVNGNYNIKIQQFSYYLSLKFSPFKKPNTLSFYAGIGASHLMRINKGFEGTSENVLKPNTFFIYQESDVFDAYQSHLDDYKTFITRGLVGIEQEFNNRLYYKLEVTSSLGNTYLLRNSSIISDADVKGSDYGLRLLLGFVLFQKSNENG